MKEFIPVKMWQWTHRHDDHHRSLSGSKVICFKHRCDVTLCHCDEDEYHHSVTCKIRIPKQKDVKGWKELKHYLENFMDDNEYKTSKEDAMLSVEILSEKDRLMYRLFGKMPEMVMKNMYNKQCLKPLDERKLRKTI